MKKINLIVGLILLVLASSCTKVKDAELAPSTKASNFKEIKVADSFKWNTNNSIILNVNGFESISAIRNTFIVSSEDKKEVYFASNTLMSESFKANFDLPIHVKKINVTFGSISKVLDVNTNTITFDYLLPIVE
ncbi:MAG: hypothetical protein ACOYMA_09995 [Bacteroidia bacterium]